MKSNGSINWDAPSSDTPNGSVKSHDSDVNVEPIAIVGLGMRLPGAIHTADELWEVIMEKRSTRCEVPSSRFNVNGFYSPTSKAGSIAMKHGHFLADSDDFRHLDTSFFSMGRKEVDDIDPQQRMLLEVVYECMQTSGQVNWRGKNIGCYVGVWGEDWLDLHVKDTQDAGMYRIPGGHDFAISNRISYEYDLKGPSFTIKAGCSSSLIALHEAVRAIRAGDCSGAIVAGTNLIFSPTMSIGMTEQGVLAPDGSCKTFDTAANGYARGEGINAIYITSLSEAVNNGDPVRAVIRATATNCDGKTPGMSMPSSEGHEALILRAYLEASLQPAQTAFVEAHGTGTPVGDPLEATAIARVFGGNDDTVYIGSVKPNLGHSEGASGVSSILKTVLALENMVIPPNINFSTPNPKIPFREANMKVPVDAIPWPKNRPLRASVNSFGIGGANAHAIIESAMTPGSIHCDVLHHANDNSKGHTNGYKDSNTDSANGELIQKRDLKSHHRKFIQVISAASSVSLRQSLIEHERYIQNNQHRMRDISYTLCNRREHLSNRAYCVTDQTDAPMEFSPLTKIKKTPSIVAVFTGQGAQWAGMAKELMDDYPSFNNDIVALGAVLSKLKEAPSWDLREELRNPEPLSNLARAEYSQPLVLAIQVALVNLLRRWGIFPEAVIGHSSGEIAAAYAAKAITADEAITIAYYRGYVTKGYTRRGGMAAIGLGRGKVIPFLRKGVVIACENSPESVTLSGDQETLETVCRNIGADYPDCFIRHLKVEMAYHSHHMLDVGESLESFLCQKVNSKRPNVPFFSSVKAKPLTGRGCLNAKYWRENFENPVLFNSAVKHLLSTQSSKQLFLEIGPHNALAGPLRQILKASNRTEDSYVAAMIRGKDCTESILKTAGELYLNGVPLDFSQIAPAGNVLTDLPLYQWRHDKEYWAESRVSKEWRFRKFPHHEILGSRVLEGNDLQPEWRNILRLEDVPWLRDHQIIEDIVFPFAGYMSIAGEAIRQISSAEDFTLRKVVVQTALILSDSRPVEMITSLRPCRLTTTLNSVWWEFCVISHNGSAWIKHCTGQVRAGTARPISQHTRTSYPRPIENLYRSLRKVGLNYGPYFQGLEQVSCLPNRMTASATLLGTAVSESIYAVHPTTIDHCLQLFFPASSDGIFRRCERLCVPTGVEQLYICSGHNCAGAGVEAVANANQAGVISGNVVAASSEGVFLSMAGAIFSPLETDLADNLDTIAGARLEWKPDLDFADMTTLIRASARSKTDSAELELVEKLTLLTIVEIDDRISKFTSEVEHLQKYSSWVKLQTARASENKYDLVPNAKELLTLDSEVRQALIAQLRREISQTGAASAAELISRILERCEDIVQGKVEGIEILQPNNGLTNYYNFVESRTESADFFTVAGHTKPTLRVLEIGAGTGGGTAVVLEGLTSTSNQERMYSTYTYTDISAGFFVAAQERFKGYQGLEFKVLDITKDPVEQGFQAGSFDLVIAGNVLHATPNLHIALINVHMLLAPHGYLFLQELSPRMQMVNLIMGILPGWWLGEGDGRVNEPYLAPTQWDKVLKNAGFSGVDAAIYDAPQPYHINANIVSRLKQAPSGSRYLTLLHSQKDGFSPHVGHIRNFLVDYGYQVDLCTLEQSPLKGQDIISVLEIETPLFEAISESDLIAFQNIIRNLGDNKIFWVTRSGQEGVRSSPGFGIFLGLARTLRSEQSIDIATLEVDCIDVHTYMIIAKLFKKFQRTGTESTDTDFEFIFLNGVVYIGRYHPVSLMNDLAHTSPTPKAVKLDIGRHGLLQSLRWVSFQTTEPRHDEVAIEPRCAGLNFRDILLTMGIVDAGSLGIGLEGSGVVVAVGSGVPDLKVGDRVFYLDDNCFSTRLTMSSLRCAKIPSKLTWEEAATMPCVYATVIHSLLDIGKLKSNQSILIHSACGGIGIAALNVCQSIGGVQIFVTVGNEEKVRYLIETFGIARENIFNSRDTSFLNGIQAATDGRGVDLVLNSLSGELLHASWQCVAPYGKMLEIGKRDFIGKAQLNMDIFEANRSFVGIDLARFDAARCHPLLSRIVKMFESGAIKPITPMRTFSSVKIEESFRYMQKGIHLGKIVVTIPEGGEGLSLTPTVPELKLDPEASYLLVGGLGGLGRAIATWMVEKGARNLLFFSRSAGKAQRDQDFFQELQCQDCTAQAIQGSVLNITDVQKIVKMTSRPIKGVLQMSMVLRDKPFIDMDISDWETAVAPKVQGTWNLHFAMPKDLDFFFATGSISGSFGTPGQANYAAGNTFLNAFVQYRKALGLPASVLHIGLMDDIGYLAQNPARAEALRAAGGYFLHEKDLLDSLHWAIVRSSCLDPTSQLTIGLRCDKALSDPTNRVIWRKDPRMGIYNNHDTSASTVTNETDVLRHFIISVEADPSVLEEKSSIELVTEEIGIKIYNFMLQPVEDLDVTVTLESLGVDSLVTIEIRNWMKRALGGVEFSTLEILNAGTISGLGTLAIESLKKKFGSNMRMEGDAYLGMKAP